MGFADPARAERLLLADLGVTAAELRTDPLVTAVAAAADPDLAVAGLSRLFAAAGRGRDPLRAALRAEEDFRDRLAAVLGVSAGLADHLARHPEDAELLRGTIARPAEAELRTACCVPSARTPATRIPATRTGRSPRAGSPRRRWPRRTGAGCCI
jgi:glutamate-ammonia-ligase adenylyltransferase